MIKRGAADVRTDALVASIRRGTLVVPDESQWITQRDVADLTSRSLRTAESRWMIKRHPSDPTSGSLQADATIASLRERKSEGHACHARRSAMDYP